MTSLLESSSFPPATGASWRRWPAGAPALSAEDLRTVHEPVRTLLPVPRVAPAALVLQAIAAGCGRRLDVAAAPPWLRPPQQWAWAALRPMLRRFGGAMLADPVGSGKTYVALAVARGEPPDHPPAVLVPAALLSQWERTARKLGVPVRCWSHERLSRGRLPPGNPRLVIIDESHHFRNPAIRRYRTLAPWLGGRRTLLLTATPVVNRMDDLAAQLLLAVRDDALAPAGIPSLRAALASGNSHPALGALILERPREHAIPGRCDRTLALPDEPTLGSLLESLDRLTLSRIPAVAALLRGVFWRAAASSPAALHAALSRYRLLLTHCRSASGGGASASRAWIQRFTGSDPSQLVLWPLLGQSEGASDLVLEDLPLLEELLAAAAGAREAADAKCALLAALLDDQAPTLVFATARDTVGYLRRRCGSGRIAWCTGERAGIGALRLPREKVLRWFGPAAESLPLDLGPSTLITTDVVAEGLDLQRARRIIHYDLPWTTVRLEQRDGRALRLGSAHASVEVIRIDPPAALEARLRQCAILDAKRMLAGRVGFGIDGRRFWRWRDDIAQRWPGWIEGDAPVLAAVVAARPALLAAFHLCGDDGVIAGVVAVRTAPDEWSEDPALVEPWLALALARPARTPTDDEKCRALDTLAPFLRERLRLQQERQWQPARPDTDAGRLLRRLQRIAREAARARDARMLEMAGRGIAFARRGHTAGEAVRLKALATLDPQSLRRALSRLPHPSPAHPAAHPVLLGLLLFGPE